eukprot:gb/GECG01012511.1/.p1 GENE.gb/GECG01012511.1/~~gb/GECG01012511.1/.p1  ORF type:complete len:707 (+),score=44.48 gb/GECG01012511.1/:1-2121(+)
MGKQYYELYALHRPHSRIDWARIFFILPLIALTGSVIGERTRRNPLCREYDSSVWRDRRDLIRGTHLSLDNNEYRQAILDSFSLNLPIGTILDPYGDYLVKEFIETGRLAKDGAGRVRASAEDLAQAAKRHSKEVALPNWENIGPMNKTVFEMNLNRTLFLGRQMDLDAGNYNQNQGSTSPEEMAMSDEEAKKKLHDAVSFARKRFNKVDQLEYLKGVATSLMGANERYAAEAFGYILELDPTDKEAAQVMVDLYSKLGDDEATFKMLEYMRKHFTVTPEFDRLEHHVSSGVRTRLAKDWGRKLNVKTTRVSRTIPRLTHDELYRPDNVEYLHGNRPFILSGIIDSTTLGSMQRKMEAVLEYFSDKTHVSYNPYGVHETSKSGPSQVRTSLKRAMKMLEYSKGKVLPDADKYVRSSQRGQHIQWMPTSMEWYPISRFLGLSNLSLPTLLQDFASGWSVGAGFGDREELRSMEEALPTRLITLGSEHSGLFMHDDTVPLSAWQLQLVGAKTWLFCAPSESDYIGEVGDIDGNGWNPQTEPQFALARCTNTTAFPGDIVYYPTKYWHQTLYHVNGAGLGENSRPLNFPWNLAPVNVALGTRAVQASKAEQLSQYLEVCFYDALYMRTIGSIVSVVTLVSTRWLVIPKRVRPASLPLTPCFVDKDWKGSQTGSKSDIKVALQRVKKTVRGTTNTVWSKRRKPMIHTCHC